MGELAHVEELAARPATTATLTARLAPELAERLAERGITLYAHQAAAAGALLEGEDVVVATPAASGKSLCGQIPVAQALLTAPRASALYLFPTKALAQDQLRGLRALLPERLARSVAVFDGDTPQGERAGVRRSARVILTNPDMLHFGILPHHRGWSRFLAGLRYVIVDESHTYRGVFGSHVANILRRLRRLCARYGADPRFLCASATIANPGEHATALTGRPARVVDTDGAPHGGRRFVFWEPPVVDRERGLRASAGSETARLLEMLLKRDVRTLAFVRTRRQAEVVYRNVRERLRASQPGLAERVRPYRASYLAEDRRAVERGLAEGELLGVVATNALELGIDIGDLDATLLAGYPGSIASTWQQAGRAGRAGQESLSVLVAQDNPLDQYLVRHPDFFFGRPHEHARIRHDNPHVLGPHLLCAAYEMPLRPSDAALFGPRFDEQTGALAAEGLLVERSGQWFVPASVDYPAGGVAVRSVDRRQFLVAEAGTGRVLEHVDEGAAFSQLHLGAVYLHQGDPYLVRELDIAAGVASVERADVEYFTQARVLTDIRVLATHAERPFGEITACFGEVEVSRHVVSFRKRGFYGAPNPADGEPDLVAGNDAPEELLDLPPRIFRTTAVWFGLPEASQRWLADEGADIAGGLHALEHAAIGVLPLFALCDRNDIGGVSTPLHPDTGEPTVFIYDGHAGGVGIAEHAHAVLTDLLTATREVIGTCACTQGCPSCIQSPKCGNNNAPLDKDIAARLLTDLLAGGAQAPGTGLGGA